MGNKKTRPRRHVEDPIKVEQAVNQGAQQREVLAPSMSIISSTDYPSKKNLDQLDPSFMYTLILKEILLTISFEQKHFKEFINYCRDVWADNPCRLVHITNLERTYGDHTPIWWYTREYFFYPMLNGALREMDANRIVTLGFFIVDLHRHIEQLHQDQFSSMNSKKDFTTYRGQGMPKEEFEKLSKTKGGLLSFNSFLSTSRERDVAMAFAQSSAMNPDLVGVLFMMTIDPSQPTTPFASVSKVGFFGDGENEMLFSMHTIFRIDEITPLSECDRLFQVEVRLTSDNDSDLLRLTNHIRKETAPQVEGWYRLGLVLRKMGHFAEAQEVYKTLLKQATSESAKAPIYHQLGVTTYNQGKYEEAIRFYEKSIDIEEKTTPRRPLNLASSYNNIGAVYHNMGDYLEALFYHNKALEIREKSLPANYPDLAASYNNMGGVYSNLNEYSNALSSHEKALEIRRQLLPPNHPDLAISHNNIGVVYEHMNNYLEACSCFKRAVEIGQQSLPLDHPDAQTYRRNLERVKQKL